MTRFRWAANLGIGYLDGGFQKEVWRLFRGRPRLANQRDRSRAYQRRRSGHRSPFKTLAWRSRVRGACRAPTCKNRRNRKASFLAVASPQRQPSAGVTVARAASIPWETWGRLALMSSFHETEFLPVAMPANLPAICLTLCGSSRKRDTGRGLICCNLQNGSHTAANVEVRCCP